MGDALTPSSLQESGHAAKIEESILRKLHPTQLTAGMIVVKDKRDPSHRACRQGSATSTCGGMTMPAVRGPGERLYVTDHHHLGRAALDAGLATAFFQVDGDFSDYSSGDFQKQMEKKPVGSSAGREGVRHYCTRIPDQLDGLGG